MPEPRLPLLLALATPLLAATLAAGPAEAACVAPTLKAPSPLNGATVSAAPTFRWSDSGCAVYKVQSSPLTPTSWTTLATVGAPAVQWGMTDDDWDSYAPSWTAGMKWRVQGLSAATVVTSPVRRLTADPDVDDDGFTVTAGGDCEDDAADVHPGATEICNGLDDDCDAATGEDGVATFVGAEGATTDYSALLAGAEDAPSAVVLDEDGVLSVCAGTWYTNIEIQADVEVVGVGGAEGVVLNGAWAASVVSVLTDGVDARVAGVTLTGGYGSFGSGLACRADGGTSVAVEDTIVTGNRSDGGNGTGLASDNCALTLTGSTVSGLDWDWVAPYGGGISAGNHSTVILEGSTVSGCLAGRGGGIYATDNSTVTLYGSAVSGNLSVRGGGIYADDDSVISLYSSVVSDNEAFIFIYEGVAYPGDGGGIYAEEFAHVYLHSSTISGNSADDDAGGIYAEYFVTLYLDSSTVSANSADDDAGGVSIYDNCALTLVGSTVLDNAAGDRGGGVYANDTWYGTYSSVEASFSTVSGNASVYGGGMFALGYGLTVDLDNSTVSDNSAEVGGGMFGIAVPITLDYVVVTGNTASRVGGGVGLGSDGKVTATNCDFGTGDNDNTPDDVAFDYYIPQQYYYGADATFELGDFPNL